MRTMVDNCVRAPAAAVQRPLSVVFASHVAGVNGGAERSLLDLVIALKRDGRIEPVVTVPQEDALARASRAEGIPVLAMPTPWWVVTPGGSRRTMAVRKAALAPAYASSLAAWARWLRKRPPDVLVTNTAVIGTPAAACMLTGVPHVWWLHEFVTKDHRMSFVVGEALAQRVIGRMSTHVVANSMAVRDHFAPPVPSGKIDVVYQAITGFAPTPNRSEAPRLRALMLGALLPSKGIEVALQAARLLHARPGDATGGGRAGDVDPDPIDLQLRLVGAGPPTYRRRLERYVADQGLRQVVEIRQATPTPQEEIAWANVILVCSDSEAFGRVTVEALMSGRPVVGTRSGGTPELISHGCNGLLVPPGDVRALASALSRLAHDPSLLAEMSARAVASMNGRFATETQVELMVALLNRAAATGRCFGEGRLR